MPVSTDRLRHLTTHSAEADDHEFKAIVLELLARRTGEYDVVRAAFVAGIEYAESGDIARFDSWSAAADDYMSKR